MMAILVRLLSSTSVSSTSGGQQSKELMEQVKAAISAVAKRLNTRV
jgi:hypothetical protein